MLDILRGVALLGMILVHFHQNMELSVGGREDLISWITWIGFEQKAWGIFAFLFGVGFAVLLRRLEARNAPVMTLYLRRLAGLAVFGIIAQVCFGFRILLEYAIWGVPLLFMRKWSTPALLATVFAAVALPPLVYLALDQYAPLARLVNETALVSNADLSQAYGNQEVAEANEDYLSLLAARARMMRLEYLRWETYLPSNSFPLFILGLLALRLGLFDAPLRHLPLILGAMAFGLASWSIVTYWRMPWGGSPPDVHWALQSAFGLIQDQWLCLTYIGAVVLLCARWPVWLKWLSPLGTAGRMALTNYMLQIAVLDYLASGYGADLKVRPLGSLLGTGVLFGTLVGFSYLWLQRFRMGPLEWLWRCFTYLQCQPLRRHGGDVQ